MTAVLALVLSTVAHADERLRGEIVEFGLVVGRYAGPMPEDGQSGLAPAESVENVRHLEATGRIEARLCRRFGITVRLLASQPLPDVVEGRVEHPTMTRPDGVQGTQARGRIAVVSGVAYLGFVFDEEWELVPGSWTLSLSSRQGEIVRKDFTVTVPAPGVPNSDCGVG